MSTKIYDGTRISATWRAEDIGRQLTKTVEPVRRQILADVVARAIHGSLFGRWPDGFDKAGDSGRDLTAGFLIWMDEAIEKEAQYRWSENPELAIELSVSFASDPDDPE